MTVIWPLTRGSTTIWRSSMAPMARDTASISALTKFSVTGALDLVAGIGGSLTWLCASGAVASNAARASGARRERWCKVMITRSK
jgi:hypothetical protein